MILLEHIWKSYGRGRKAKDVLTDIDATLDFSSGNIGILGGRKSGKTTLLNIIAGITQPSEGRVKRRARVSWPLSWRGFGKGMTGDGQIAFLCRLYQADPRATFHFVAEMTGLDRKLYAPLADYSARDKDRLMSATLLALDFDVYLVDDRMPNMATLFDPSYADFIRARLQAQRVLMTTSHAAQATQHCTLGAVLVNGQLSSLMAAEAASEAHRATARRQTTRTP